MELIVKLLLVHVISDFFLRSQKCSDLRKEHTIMGTLSSGIHALWVALLTYMIVANWHCWWMPLSIFLTHWIIDVYYNRQNNGDVATFIISQTLHIFVICLVCYFYIGFPPIRHATPNADCMLYTLSYLSVLAPSSVLIKLFTKQWEPENNTTSLPNAGKWIGYLERILILTFIYAGHIEGIGFLLAAKSVFRFGDLNRAKDVRTTEYVLLGTFLSFAISILIGFGVTYILS